MKLTLTSLAVAAPLFAGSASAFNLGHQELKDTNEFGGGDLSADRRDADLSFDIFKDGIRCNTTMLYSDVICSGCWLNYYPTPAIPKTSSLDDASYEATPKR